MDVVITYVNGLDPVWRNDYEKCTKIPLLEKRFRDWGTLKYIFRGIEVNMPFVRKVHLVVSGESQVPEWIDRDSVNVVLHKDIIPAELLPTFNSNTIELHMHRIADLDEEFVYFNDDIFPLRPIVPEDFFCDGRGVIGMSRHLFAWDMFKTICRNSDHAARKALGLSPGLFFLRPQHTCAPMLRSESKRLYETIKSDLFNSFTITRASKNITQYVFTNYLYLQGKIINKRQSKRHFSVGIASASTIRDSILKPKHKLVCINDVRVTDERYMELRRTLIAAFEERFPKKSKYEK